MTALGILIILVSVLISLVGSVMLIIVAFRVSVTWGLLVLFVPFAALIFLVKYWQDAKKPFLISVSGTALQLFGVVVLGMGAGPSISANDMTEIAVEPSTSMARRSAPSSSAGGSLDVSSGADSRDSSAPVRVSAPAYRPPIRTSTPRTQRRSTARVPIDVSALDKYVGKRLVFVQSDGPTIHGELLEVHRNTVEVKRYVAGGTITHSLDRRGLTEVRQAG